MSNPELLLPSLAGGYVHYNEHAQTKLKDYLTGTTSAKYVLPGWEVAWLYYKDNGHAHAKPIRVGEHHYQLIGSHGDIKALMKARQGQVIAASRTTTRVGTDTGAFVPDERNNKPGHERERGAQSAQEEYFWGGGTQVVEVNQGMFLRLQVFEKAIPPSTLAREAMLAFGNNFVGVPGMTAVSLAQFLHDGIEAAGGFSVTEEANKHLGVKKLFKFMLNTDKKTILEFSVGPFTDALSLPLPTTFGDVVRAMEKHSTEWK